MITRQGRPRSWAAATARPILFVALILACLLGGCGRNPDLRQAKKETLARWEDHRLAPVDSLMTLLHDDDAHVRLAALRSAGLIGRGDVLPVMIDLLLTDRSPTVRAQAAFSLGLAGDAKALPALEAATNDPHANIRAAALRGLAHVPNAGTALLRSVGAIDPAEAALAWDALRNQATGVDSTALREAILAGLARPEAEIQWRVLRCLERFPVVDLAPVAVPFARANPVQVRVHAYRALSRLTTPDALTAVLDGWDHHPKRAERNRLRLEINALSALGHLAGQVSKIPEPRQTELWDRLAAVLSAGAGSDDPHVAETALTAMQQAVAESPLPAEAADQESLLPVWRIRLARAAHSYLDRPQIGVRAAAAAAWAELRGAGAAAELADRVDREGAPSVLAALLTAVGRHDPDPLPLLTRYGGAGTDLGRSRVRAAALGGIAHALGERDLYPTDSVRRAGGLDLLRRSTRDPDFVTAATAADLLGEFPDAATLQALCDAWDAPAGPGRPDVRLAVLGAIERVKPALASQETLIAELEVPVLQAAFDSPDLRIRLAARQAALAGGSLPGHLIPSEASLKATLPVFRRHRDQTPVALPADLPRVRCVTDRGAFVIALAGDIAPNTCAVFLDLIERDFYRGLSFHRVVPDFVVQGGDPRGDGWGGPGYTIRSEWSEAPYRRAAVGIAHSGKDTGGSQFFVTLSEQPHLNGRYTVFGEVVAGMEIVDTIQVGDRFDLEIVRE